MNLAKEMPLSEWHKKKFPTGKPTLRALQKQCKEGIIPAVKRGGWYVLYEKAEAETGNDLVDMVLEG